MGSDTTRAFGPPPGFGGNFSLPVAADRQILFSPGDEVSFSARGEGRLCGVIEKLNPTRALLRRDTEVWEAPYSGIRHVCEATAKDRENRLRRLEQVAFHALELLKQHGLAGWSLRFNSSRKNLGQCRYRQKLILLSRSHAVEGTQREVTDTILHEIAHALAGPAAGHGSKWKAIARRLGATPRSCAPESEQARSEREAARVNFQRGDAVSFQARGKLRTGIVEKINPKRAKVRCADSIWRVPYGNLEKQSQS